MRSLPTQSPHILFGNAYQRGEQQSDIAPELGSDVKKTITNRLERSKALLAKSASVAFLKAQWEFSEKHAAAHLDEVCGLAKGYDVSPRDLFAYLHLGAMEDGDPEKDGCSVAVISDTKNGPLLAKNRDFGAVHQKLQRVVRHQDPLNEDLWCMFITSLGSPGAYSSGINSHGLAVADTAIGCSKLGVGWLRYFLMTEILWKAASVDEALDLISSVPHVGGGALVLGR